MHNVETISELDIITVDVPILSSSPVMVITAFSAGKLEEAPKGTEMKITTVAKSYFSEWWCINDHFGALL